MIKILKYELRIILLKPYIFAMTIVTLLYSFFLLSSEIILGVSDTAPFSGWSFGKYLGDSTIVSLVVTLFILASTYSKRMKMIELLTEVTGFSKRNRVILRSIIIGGYFLLSNFLILVMGCIFMKGVFGKMYLGNYIVDWILITFPCLFIILGIGNLLGKINPVLIYIFMIVIVVMAFVMKELFIDLNGANYFEVVSSKMETLKGGETEFLVTGRYTLTRIMYAILGFAAYVAAFLRLNKKQKYS